MILVLPASRPSADWNTIVIFGPSLRILVTATHRPTTVATIGMIHTSESLVFFLATALDSGIEPDGVCGSAMVNLLRICSVPNQARVERLDREHRQHHYRGEEEQAGPWLDRHQGLKLDQCRGKGVHEYVNHGPTSDELNRTEQPQPPL